MLSSKLFRTNGFKIINRRCSTIKKIIKDDINNELGKCNKCENKYANEEYYNKLYYKYKLPACVGIFTIGTMCEIYTLENNKINSSTGLGWAVLAIIFIV